ncbi:outer membrane lipoprotein carrier protein LolA [bacterium]|nr:outer membrane lipoprotein carrier protein LolA [bacterium]
MKFLALIAVTLLNAAGPAAKPAVSQAAADASLENLQASWDKTTSYEADFIQTIKSKTPGLDEEPSRGVIAVEKPLKMRWEDKTAKATQLLNGKEYWEITENTRRKSRAVTHEADVSKNLAKSSLQVLAGTGKFKDFYKVKLVKENEREAVLELIPKAGGNETLTARLDKNGYVLRTLTTESPDSTVTVEFKNIKRNLPFSEKTFRYEKQANDAFEER